MSLWKPVELALVGGARLAWPVFQAINRQFEAKSFQPRWSAAPLHQEPRAHQPPLGWPRTTDSLCPTCVRETRARSSPASRPSRRWSTSTSARSRRTSSSATARSSIEKTCPEHGTFTDTLSINPAFLKRIESLFPGPRFPRRHRHAAQPRHVVDQVRPRRGADHRPDQPLQHDVRPVLHGRQPGRLRPRADARGRQAAARRRGRASSRGGR